MKELTQELLKELLHYNPNTGVFTWKMRSRNLFNYERLFKRFNTQFNGAAAGSVHKPTPSTKYIVIRIFGVIYKAHRLAWLYEKGCFPKLCIDHINGNSLDNRIINLRDVSHKENCKNAKTSKSNSSGSKGVNFCKSTKKWRARITVEGKEISLGRFTSIIEATKARKDAEKEHGYHKNHGRKS